MSPNVSILIPVYNRATLIRETVRAACAQTFEDLEVVVCDNASTDGTWEVLQELAAADPRVRIVRHAENIGPVRNWISCLDNARGRFGKILWSDDLIDPRFLAETLPWLDDPSVGFVYTAARIFRGEAAGRDGVVVFDSLAPGRHEGSVFIDGALHGGDFPVSPGCALFRMDDLRRNLWRDIPNRLDIDFSRCAIGNDLLVFLLTAAQYPEFAFVQQPLSHFRDHSDSITVSSAKGRIPLYYDIAKAAFVETTGLSAPRLRRFNAKLWFDRLYFGGREHRIERTADFYPTWDPPVSVPAAAAAIAGELRRRLLSPARWGRLVRRIAGGRP